MKTKTTPKTNYISKNICPKCSSPHFVVEEFNEADGKDMSEGELAEYLAGTRGSLVCLDCGYTTEYE